MPSAMLLVVVVLSQLPVVVVVLSQLPVAVFLFGVSSDVVCMLCSIVLCSIYSDTVWPGLPYDIVTSCPYTQDLETSRRQ